MVLNSLHGGPVRHARIGRGEKLIFGGRAAAAWPFEAGERASHFRRAAALRNLRFAFGPDLLPRLACAARRTQRGPEGPLYPSRKL